MTVSLHAELAEFNQERLAPGLPRDDWRESLARDQRMRVLEGEFVESERLAIADLASRAPSTRAELVAWFEALKENGPGQQDPLFPWLAGSATRREMKWFLRQEIAAEAGFDDLVALAQLKLPERPKLELARNYWDEMGRGYEMAMHGPMLSRLTKGMRLDPTMPVVSESLALANLMIALASNRRYAFQALGALGVIELTTPAHAEKINAGLKRLHVTAPARQYFALHAAVDVEHSAAWSREVLGPLVEEQPDAARAIAEGALMRLEAGRRCFARYREELGCAPSLQYELAELDAAE